MRSNFWQGKRVAVLGGAALIGSHLVERLIEEGVGSIWVADDLSSGVKENLPRGIALYELDLRVPANALYAVADADVVFHLACAHGGRGYVDTHPVQCFDNLSLDATVFRACAERGVGKVVFASSACVYPTHIQDDRTEDLWLVEAMVDRKQPSFPDGAYGWAKLMAEYTMDAYIEAGHFNGVHPRFFTVYGPRMRENHAICALIAKTFIKQDPFEIWGNGEQVRNWTYVTDTVNGLVLAAEKMVGGAVNIGTEERLTPLIAANLIWEIMGWRPSKIVFKTDAPVGVTNRVADATKARTDLGWRPQMGFAEGLARTINWYVGTHDVGSVRENLQKALTER